MHSTSVQLLSSLMSDPHAACLQLLVCQWPWTVDASRGFSAPLPAAPQPQQDHRLLAEPGNQSDVAPLQCTILPVPPLHNAHWTCAERCFFRVIHSVRSCASHAGLAGRPLSLSPRATKAAISYNTALHPAFRDSLLFSFSPASVSVSNLVSRLPFPSPPVLSPPSLEPVSNP